MSEDYSLVESFDNSISENIEDIALDVFEMGIDTMLDDEVFKNVPFLSVVYGAYKIGRTVKERHYVKQLANFIYNFNIGIIDTQMRDRIKAKLNKDKKTSKKELEYILLIIDSFISKDNSAMIAKLYLAYSEQKITWLEFTKYAEAIRRFFPGDYEALKSNWKYDIYENRNSDDIFRLVGLGLVAEANWMNSYRHTPNPYVEKSALIIPDNKNDEKNKTFIRTEFGSKLVDILEGNLTEG